MSKYDELLMSPGSYQNVQIGYISGPLDLILHSHSEKPVAGFDFDPRKVK